MYLHNITRTSMIKSIENFKENPVISACEVFRTYGFHGSSISDLVEATKLNRKILYDHFKNKAGIFNAALDFYIEKEQKIWKDYLCNKPFCFENIESLFCHVASTMDKRGSLIILVISESFNSPESSVERCHLALNTLKNLIIQNLSGKCTSSDIQNISEVLTFQFAALSARAQMGASQDELLNFCGHLLEGIKLNYYKIIENYDLENESHACACQAGVL